MGQTEREKDTSVARHDPRQPFTPEELDKITEGVAAAFRRQVADLDRTRLPTERLSKEEDEPSPQPPL